MKKITIFIEENVPENIVQPFVPQIASCMLRDMCEQEAFKEGVKAGLATKELLEVIEFIDTDDKCHCDDKCDCGDNCECDDNDKCDDSCDCDKKESKSNKSSKTKKSNDRPK